MEKGPYPSQSHTRACWPLGSRALALGSQACLGAPVSGKHLSIQCPVVEGDPPILKPCLNPWWAGPSSEPLRLHEGSHSEHTVGVFLEAAGPVTGQTLYRLVHTRPGQPIGGA